VRVLHVDSARGWRGGQNQVLLTAVGMQARGIDVTLACQGGGVLETRARQAGIHCIPLRFHSDISPMAILGLRRVFEERAIDVVQLHDPHAVSAGVFAARGRIPIVATRRVDFPLRGRLSRRKYRACRRVICVSEAIVRVLEAAGVAAERLHLVHEGVLDRPALPDAESALRELGVPRNSLVVGTVAALTDHKDYETLIAAAALVAPRFPRVRFLAVGDGELRSALEQRVRDAGLREQFIFAGFRDDVDRLLPVFTIFCLCSHMEGLGTSLLDAMAFQLPIAATAAGGIPDAIEDGVTGRLVPPRNPSALAEALVGLLSDEEERRRLGAAARQRFDAEFTADQMVERTLEVLEVAIGSGSRASRVRAAAVKRSPRVRYR